MGWNLVRIRRGLEVVGSRSSGRDHPQPRPDDLIELPVMYGWSRASRAADTCSMVSAVASVVLLRRGIATTSRHAVSRFPANRRPSASPADGVLEPRLVRVVDRAARVGGRPAPDDGAGRASRAPNPPLVLTTFVNTPRMTTPHPALALGRLSVADGPVARPRHVELSDAARRQCLRTAWWTRRLRDSVLSRY